MEKEPTSARWYFFGPESNQPLFDPFPPASALGLSALVATRPLNFTADDAAAEPSLFEGLERQLAPWRGATVIVPDTYNLRAVLNAFIAWHQAKAPRRGLEAQLSGGFSYSWRSRPPDADVVVTAADFGITGLFENDSWVDLPALQNLLELLHAAPGPGHFARIPPSAVAPSPVPIKMQILDALSPALTAAGWERTDTLGLPLTEPGLAGCSVFIDDRRTEIWFGSEVVDESDLRTGLEARCEEFERLSPQPLDKIADGLIWRDTGGAADDVDWEQRAISIADSTEGLRSALTDLIAMVEQAHERHVRQTIQVRDKAPSLESDPAAFLASLHDSYRGDSAD